MKERGRVWLRVGKGEGVRVGRLERMGEFERGEGVRESESGEDMRERERVGRGEREGRV